MKVGLVLIDIQNDYFPGGKFELKDSVLASLQARKLLDFCRQQQLAIFHIQHISLRSGATFFFPNTPGAEIHSNVQPYPGEVVIQKHHPNCFRASTLKSALQAAGVQHLVVCGMMTHLAIDATVRVAYDEGFQVTVIADACTTRSLTFREMQIPADHVHAASLAALNYLFAKVQTVDEFITDYSTPRIAVSSGSVEC